MLTNHKFDIESVVPFMAERKIIPMDEATKFFLKVNGTTNQALMMLTDALVVQNGGQVQPGIADSQRVEAFFDKAHRGFLLAHRADEGMRQGENMWRVYGKTQLDLWDHFPAYVASNPYPSGEVETLGEEFAYYKLFCGGLTDLVQRERVTFNEFSSTFADKLGDLADKPTFWNINLTDEKVYDGLHAMHRVVSLASNPRTRVGPQELLKTTHLFGAMNCLARTILSKSVL